jgi:ABC-type glycerol-3-phosphate transport system substrate-binding protein
MSERVTRRRALKLGAASAALPLVHIRTAGAAGKLKLALWDHWVPSGDAALQKIVDAWAEKNKVDVQLDFLTGVGEKINITMAAEAQARTGHDIYAFDMWTVHEFADKLTPVDDIMKTLTDKYGKVSKAYEYLGIAEGHWRAMPVGWGSAPLTPCARISMMKKYAGIDVQAWYPAHESTPDAAKDWTYETQLRAAEACHKAGFPFAFGCGSGSTDARQTWGATFGAFGADLINAKGEPTLDTDNVKMALEYCQRLIPFLPADTVQYDDASNNRALISGKSAMIWNPPSAWAVAKRDAPQIAEDCWTFPNPKGPKGRLVPMRPYFWGIWEFAQNKPAAKDLLLHLAQREQVEPMGAAVAGYDIPPFQSMTDFKIWKEVGPPTGTIFNYPVRPWHDAEYYITGSSGPPEVAVQMWNRSVIPGMVSRMVAKQTIPQVIAWAKDEISGFRR